MSFSLHGLGMKAAATAYTYTSHKSTLSIEITVALAQPVRHHRSMTFSLLTLGGMTEQAWHQLSAALAAADYSKMPSIDSKSPVDWIVRAKLLAKKGY